MKIVCVRLSNFCGILNTTEIRLDDFKVLVGRNDAGKSTVLRALAFFLNEQTADADCANVNSNSSEFAIELLIRPDSHPIIIDESVETTFEQEELVNQDELLQVKRVWNVSKSRPRPDTYILRKFYQQDADFVLLSERELIRRCGDLEIETHKANGEEFNNVEKREKLRTWHQSNNTPFTYEEEKLPTSGKSRAKLILDVIRAALPRFEFFEADTSLSETDTVIQNYFRDVASTSLEEFGTQDLEAAVRSKVEGVLRGITDKINRVVPSDEKVFPHVDFDWRRLVSTSFRTQDETADVPLSLRGDGFRRITMMAYFEYLAENSADPEKGIFFGFEEPETFLHPSAQENLFEKLIDLSESGYQVLVSTHSPILVANTRKQDLIHLYKERGDIRVEQEIRDVSRIAQDLGISVDNQFVTLFDRAKVLLLVEGIDDADAIEYVSETYEAHDLIETTLDELDVAIIPIGGKESIQHWVALDLLKKLSKPFLIYLDSDKSGQDSSSPTRDYLVGLGFVEGTDFLVTRKRSLENYLCCNRLNTLVPGANLTFCDWDDVKSICKEHKLAGKLGGKKVVARHFRNMTFHNLRGAYNDPQEGDEFLSLHSTVTSKL